MKKLIALALSLIMLPAFGALTANGAEGAAAAITDIYADVYGIVLTLDAELTGAPDSEYVSLISSRTGRKAVISDIFVSGNQISIMTPLERDVMYGLTIKEGFGDGAMSLEEDYSINFKAKTVAFADFEDFSAGSLKRYDAFGGFRVESVGQVFEVIDDEGDNKLVLAGNIALSTQTQHTKYTLSFDAEGYSTGNNGDTWFKIYTNSSSQTAASGNNIRPNNTNFTFAGDLSSTVTYLNSATWLATLRSQFLRWLNGSDAATKPATLGNTFADMNITTRAVEGNVGVRALGTSFALIKNNTLIGSLVDSRLVPARGYLRMSGSNSGAYIINDILATEFEIVTEASIMFAGGLETSPFTNEDTIDYGLNVANFSDADKAYAAAVAAYGEDGQLLGFEVAREGTLSAGAIDNLSGSVSGVLGTESMYAFLWDSTQALNLYAAPIATSDTQPGTPADDAPKLSVYASDIEKSIMTLSGTADSEYITVMLLPENGTFSDLQANSANSHIQVIKADAGGFEYSFKFMGENGKYVLHTAPDIGTYGPFNYVSRESIEDFVGDLGSQSVDKSEIFKLLSEYAVSIGADMAAFSTAKKQDYLAAALYAGAELIQAGGIAAINELVTKAENELKFFDALKDTVAVSGVNRVFQDYADVVGLDITQYSNLSSNTKKESVCRPFINSSYQSMEAFVTDFNKAVAAAKLLSDDRGTGTSSQVTGGSGVSSNAGRVDTVHVETVDKASEKVAKMYFNDLESVASWASDAINHLYENGIINGIRQSVFAPNDYITREQLAKIVVLAFNVYDPAAQCSFTDVPAEGWAYPYVASAKKSGFIFGVSDSEFMGGQYVTREDLAAVIYRAAISAGKTFGSAKTDFSDYSLISAYARDAVAAMAGEGIIQGISGGAFAPNEYATRAQTAKIIYAIIG